MHRIIFIFLVLGACSPNARIVYFKPQKIHVQESKSHAHGYLHSPHYSPIRENKHNFDVMSLYSQMYEKRHSEIGTKPMRSSRSYVITYLILTFLTLL